MRCAICCFSISKNDRKAKLFSIWREVGGDYKREHKTDLQAHVVCLEGKPYDARQMTMFKEEGQMTMFKEEE